MAIRQLKTRTLADKFANDVRASRRKSGRFIYMGLVVVTAVWLADLFAGPYLWLDVGGLVSADRTVISPANDSQVVAMYVSPGQMVRKGQIIGLLHSPGVTQAVADLKTRYADAAAKAAELNIRLNVARSVEQVAIERLKLAQENHAKLASMHGYVADLTVQASMQQLYDAQLQVATQKAQQEGADDQLHNLNATLRDAQQSIADIESRYNDGKVLAEDDGIMGAQIAQKGDLLRPGDLLIELFTGRPYVLAYLETNALYAVRVGDHVRVRAGFRETEGTVTEVRPIAVQLPPEFQKTFRPRGRGQVAKIELKNADFALSTKVEITGDSYLPEDWVVTGSRYVLRVVQPAEGWTHAFLEWVRGHVDVSS
jgi:multidrug resistance efflux pump